MYKKEMMLEEEDFGNGSHSPSSSIALPAGAVMLHPHITAVLILWFLMRGRSHLIMQ
jgi:hypothetical protein